ncbi:9627_t:CDS:1, partial [Dentiscutata erythropus]
ENHITLGLFDVRIKCKNQSQKNHIESIKNYGEEKATKMFLDIFQN